MSGDYAEWAERLGLATKEEVKEAFHDPDTVFVDVRTKEEVAEVSLKSKPYVHHCCRVESCDALKQKAEESMKDRDAPVVIFCRSGQRAVQAKEILVGMGYKRVLNAGGLSDLGYLEA